MPVTLTCPHCQASLKAPDEVLGKKIRCKKCESPFLAVPPGPQPLLGKHGPERERPRPEAEDEDQDEDRPRRRRKKTQKDRTWLVFGLVAGCVGLGVLCVVGVTGHFLLTRKPADLLNFGKPTAREIRRHGQTGVICRLSNPRVQAKVPGYNVLAIDYETTANVDMGVYKLFVKTGDTPREVFVIYSPNEPKGTLETGFPEDAFMPPPGSQLWLASVEPNSKPERVSEVLVVR